MTIKKLASEISKREGKIKQVSIGNIREVLAILSDLVWEEIQATSEGQDLPIGTMLCKNGMNRAKRNKKNEK